MAKIEDIAWSSYQEYEGPFYRGKTKFSLPPNPTLIDKRLAAITAIESGHYDAINMYDRMILTVGLIQWGEANTFSVSKLLGHMCDAGLEPVIQGCLRPALNASGATFKITPKGNWRFFIGDAEVNSIALQQKLFLGCDGRKGKWTDETKARAKQWAVCMASILEDPKTIEIQKTYTGDRLLGFVTSGAKKILFDDTDSSTWAEATRTIYLTYAINLPRIASDMLNATKFIGEKWSPEWCLCLIKKLTHGPNIKIYPARYNAVRPVIENLYGIELPKNADLLNVWKPAPVIEDKQDLSVEPIITQPVQPVQIMQPVITEGTLIELNQIVSPVSPTSQTSFLKLILDFLRKIFNL
jgi:hypothetical protein